MPEFAGRAEAEAAIARVLGRIGGEIAREVTEALGDPPDITKLTPELWSDIEQRYVGALRPELERTFLAALQQMADESGFSIDWTVANQMAADWARSYTFDLVTGINERTRALLRDAVSDFFESGLTIDDLKDKIAGAFGPVRAEMIAVTETTRAVSQGEKALVDELARAGAVMVAVWNTSMDDRVCPICGPREQTRQGDGWTELPPAHVGCRCWTSYEPVDDA